MKSMAKVIGLVSLFCAIIWVPTDSRAASLGAMRVGLAEGDVQVKISETGEWAPVAVNTPLLEGDEIWVPDGSRAALQTNNGADIRLDGGTAFQLLRMDRDSYQFHVTEGYVYVLNRSPERTVLQFDTPDASIRSFGRSTFRIDIPRGDTHTDFDANGRWVNVREYGYVWTPTVVVAGDWAPYRHGRWVWRGGEYVWIGYEPWGWAPYHYGRWAFEVRIGWVL